MCSESGQAGRLNTPRSGVVVSFCDTCDKEEILLGYTYRVDADLPDEALRVVGEEHEPLLPVHVERRQQPVPRLLPHLLLEHAAEVGHLGTGDMRSGRGQGDVSRSV